MSKSAMLRTRRRDVNVKPNRRLDRKSSRGMIYENEELRLRTININAEIERGQSDIKKLRKENEQLRKEIWCLRDEYDKLDRLLKEKHDCTSSSDSESCTSCSESEDAETTQNLENVQKTNLNSLRNDFDHLSVVTEETSAENSENSQHPLGSPLESTWEVLAPDMGYPGGLETPKTPKNPRLINTTQSLHLNGSRTLLAPCEPPTALKPPKPGFIFGGQCSTLPLPSGNNPQCPRHFFAPLKSSRSDEHVPNPQVLTTFTCVPPVLGTPSPPQNSLAPINLVPIHQKGAPDILVQSNADETSTNSFVNGGTLDELLQDIDNISQDILKISANKPEVSEAPGAPFKSEISVVLMPKPMPLLGFDKYHQSSLDSLDTLKHSNESIIEAQPLLGVAEGASSNPPESTSPQNVAEEPMKPSNPFFFGNFEKFKPPEVEQPPAPSTPKPEVPPSPQSKRTRKLSIYFKGKKDKLERSLSLDVKPKTDSDNQKSSDSKTSYDKKHRKSSSTSPERRHVHIQDNVGVVKKHHQKKRQRKHFNRTSLTSLDRRSFSECTDRSNILGGFDSERDRSNSLSSCDTITRKQSQIPQLTVTGKIPWFGCWGNGCL